MKPQISIPEPCHENWNSMTAAEKGRHCAVCDKVVKDFTGMKNEEIIEIITHTEEDVCGRFHIDQVKPSGFSQLFSIAWKRLVWGKALIPVMSVLGLGAFSKVQAQKLQGKVQMMGGVRAEPEVADMKNIRFQVKRDSDKKAIEGAQIMLSSGGNQIASGVTNSSGQASIQFDTRHLISGRFDIAVYGNYGGYKQYKDVYVVRKDTTILVSMEDDERFMVMGIIAWNPEDTVKPEHQPVDTIVTEPEKIQDSTSCPQKTEMELFPNPSSGLVNVVINNWQEKTYFVEDMNARKIMKGNIPSRQFTLDFGGFSKGTYLMVIFHKGAAVETRKIIVQ